jgi:ribonuclease VapC
MVVDSSALLAILLGEDDGGFYSDAIDAATDVRLSAVTALEASIVVNSRRGIEGVSAYERLLESSSIRIIAFDAEQFTAAQTAWLYHGKGRHRAGLNLDDCCSYALARVTGEPLLYKGDDFARTDIVGICAPK